MTAPAAARQIGPSVLPPRHRRLARGIAAAGALSVAVHAGVLLGRASSGNATADGAPPAPVLQTRLIAESQPTVTAKPEPVVAPPPVPLETPPPAEPARVATLTPTIDREATAARPLAAPPPAAPAAEPVPAPTPKPPPVAPAVPPVATADTSPLAAPPAPTVTYQGAMGLDPPPRPLGDIDPAIPEAAGSRGGVVVLRIYINENGGVDKAEVLRSTPPGLFDASAVEAALRVRFAPGYLGGVAVKSQATYEVQIRAVGSGAEAGGRTY